LDLRGCHRHRHGSGHQGGRTIHTARGSSMLPRLDYPPVEGYSAGPVMNTHPGLVGRKLGMTQIFEEDGTVVPCTVVEARPIVVGKRTKEKDGYDALILGIEDRKEKHTSKPLAGAYKKSGVPARRVIR